MAMKHYHYRNTHTIVCSYRRVTTTLGNLLNASTHCQMSCTSDPQESLQIKPQEAGASVTVVGDTHGQMHDVLNMWGLSPLYT